MRRVHLQLALVLAMSPGTLSGSDIATQGSEVMAGASAATLTLSSTCSEANHLEVSGNVNGGTFKACSGIEADARLSGSVQLEAGLTIGLRTGFGVAAGSTLAVRLTPSLYQDAFLIDTSPQMETVYAARWWVNTDDYAPNGATRFDHFVARDVTGDAEFRVVVEEGVTAQIFLDAFDDTGGFSSTAAAALALPSSGWHSVKVVWNRSSGADDGSAEVCIDEISCSSLTALDNDTGVVDRVEWGARNLEGGAAGMLHLDEFESFRNAGLQE